MSLVELLLWIGLAGTLLFKITRIYTVWSFPRDGLPLTGDRLREYHVSKAMLREWWAETIFGIGLIICHIY